MEDHRKHIRYLAWFPARIERSQAMTQVGITHNISQGGAMIVCNTRWSPGETVSVTLRVPESSQEKIISGRIVRVEPNEEDPDGSFPHRIAIQFDEPMPELESVMQRIETNAPAPDSERKRL
jgi:Tfp pilus assembly protein PilZ